MRKGGLAAMVVLALFITSARAAEESVDATGFDPPADPYGYVTLGGAKALEPGEVHAAAYLSWAHNSLGLEESRGRRAGRRVLDDLYLLDLVAGGGVLAFWKSALALGAVFPVLIRENGWELEDPDDRLREAGVGDLRTDAKVAILDRDSDRVGLAARLWVRWPTGDGAPFASWDGLGAGALATVETRTWGSRLSLHLGYEWLEGDARMGPIRWDDRLHFGAGLAVAPLSDIRSYEPLELVFEARHSARAEQPWRSEEESPVEVGGALRWAGALFAMLGAGGGLGRGAGAADSRIYCALGTTF